MNEPYSVTLTVLLYKKRFYIIKDQQLIRSDVRAKRFARSTQPKKFDNLFTKCLPILLKKYEIIQQKMAQNPSVVLAAQIPQKVFRVRKRE